MSLFSLIFYLATFNWTNSRIETEEDLRSDVLTDSEPATGDQIPSEQGTPIMLSWLRRSYEKKQRSTAARDIKEKHWVKIDDDYIVPRELQSTARHGYVKMDIDDHCIDFIQFVGRYIGLSAIIPNNNVDISWTFKMQLPSQAYNFKSTKHGRLGFDPAGRMIFLGYCRQQTVWIAIVHESFFRPDLGDTAPPGTSSGHHVTRNQFRKFCLYLAACMSHLAIGDIYCRDPFAYPDIPGQFERSTNIL